MAVTISQDDDALYGEAATTSQLHVSNCFAVPQPCNRFIVRHCGSP